MWDEIHQIIQAHQNFIITTHVNPDGDGIGAASALLELLLMMKKEAKIIIDGKLPKKFSFLNFHKLIETYDEKNDYSKTEIVIILDTNRKQRIGRVQSLIKREVKVICIDHHVPHEVFTTYNAIDPNACSSGSLVYTLFKEFGYDLNVQAAEGIYASVMCDTGRFSNSTTSRNAHHIADECIKLGVDPDVMYSRLYEQVTIKQFKVFSRALQRMEIHLDNSVVVQQFRLEDCLAIGMQPSDLEQFDMEYIHEFSKLIEDVECVVLLQEFPENRVRVSMRSKSDLNVEKIMRNFGGGGHPKAAGALCQGSLSDIKNKLLEMINLQSREKCDIMKL